MDLIAAISCIENIDFSFLKGVTETEFLNNIHQREIE